jgi:hypothetical protein
MLVTTDTGQVQTIDGTDAPQDKKRARVEHTQNSSMDAEVASSSAGAYPERNKDECVLWLMLVTIDTEQVQTTNGPDTPQDKKRARVEHTQNSSMDDAGVGSNSDGAYSEAKMNVYGG